MNPCIKFEKALATIDEDLAADRDLDVEILTLACQDLERWASTFDPDRGGASRPSEADRIGLAQALERLKEAQAFIEGARETARGRLREARTTRRGLNGYAFLKPCGDSRQFVDVEI